MRVTQKSQNRQYINNRNGISYSQRNNPIKTQKSPINTNINSFANMHQLPTQFTQKTNTYNLNNIQYNKEIRNPQKLIMSNLDIEKRRIASFKDALKQAKTRINIKKSHSSNQNNFYQSAQKYNKAFEPKQSSIIDKLNSDKVSFDTSERLLYSIFYEQLYTSLNSSNKKMFKKQCLKLSNKKIFGDSWIFNITCKPKQHKLTLNADILNSDLKQRNLILIFPKQNQVLQYQQNYQYLFNFSRKFQPIIFKIQGQRVLAPICMISMLKPLIQIDQSSLGNESRVIYQSQIALSNVVHRLQQKFTLNDQIFQNIDQIARILFMEKFQQGQRITYEGAYQFYNSKMTIKIRERQNKQNSRLGQISKLSNYDYQFSSQNVNETYLKPSNLSKFNDQKYLISIYLKKSQNIDKAQVLLKQLVICLEKNSKIKKISRSSKQLINNY